MATKKKGPITGAQVLKRLQARLGKENARSLSDTGMSIGVRGVIPTGHYGIDWDVIGRGGLPLGRLVILHGKESDGKTTLVLHTIASCQGMGGEGYIFDTERKLDTDYAAALGVDNDKFIYTQTDNLEDTFESMDDIISASIENRANGHFIPVVVCLDSMNSIKGRVVEEAKYGDSHMAVEPRIYSQELPKLMNKLSRSDVCLIFVSQMRTKFGVQYGDPSEIAGGHAPKHHASIILGITRVGSDTNSAGDRKNNKCRVTGKKNQIAPPFRKTEVVINFGQGIDFGSALLGAAVKAKLAKKAGSSYRIPGRTQPFKGQAAAAEWLMRPENAAFKSRLEEALKKKREGKPTKTKASAANEDG